MLCDECRTIFTTPLVPKERWTYKYWFASHEVRPSWSQLKKLAAICYICSICAIEVLRDFPDLADECQVDITHGLSIYDGNGNNDTYISIPIKPEGLKASAYVRMELLQTTTPNTSGTLRRASMDYTGSTSSIDFARSCLGNCTTKHSTCDPARHGEPWYPTRLIEIRAISTPSKPAGFVVNLVNTNNHKPDGPYCSLSHCWGKVELFKLLKDNVTQVCAGLDLSLLPQTFLDAMQVALSLGINYIWIDTLCIIQDSVEDWRHEASRMSEVYLYAYLNIAATKAENATRGLFAERNRALLTAVVHLDHGPRPGTYQLLAQKYWSRMVEEGVLNQRAWVLQERLLSSRTLHFTDDQLIWDCCESLQLETFQDPVDERGLNIIGPTGPKCNQNLLSMQAKDAENGDKWLEVVHFYSRCLLSYQADKLFAIAGLVKQFEQLVGDSYCAGMWRKTMLFHLTWYTRQPQKIRKTPNESRAPSWSWLSFDGEVTIPTAQLTPEPYHEKVKLTEILGVETSQEQSVNGDVFVGHLELRVALTPVSSDGSRGLKLTDPVLPPFKADRTRLGCKFEYESTISENVGPFFYIPIWCLLRNQATLEFKDTCQIHGLIIRVKDGDPLTYERCAHACLSTDLMEPLRGDSSYFQAVMGARQASAAIKGDTDPRSLYQTTIRLA